MPENKKILMKKFNNTLTTSVLPEFGPVVKGLKLVNRDLTMIERENEEIREKMFTSAGEGEEKVGILSFQNSKIYSALLL